MKSAIFFYCASALLLQLFQAAPAGAGGLFRADSKQPGPSKMDIVIRETGRRPQSSLVEITINNVGSSVGSSFFLLCSLRNLGRARGYPRYIAKAEDFPIRGTWLVAFLTRSDDDPRQADRDLARFKGPLPVIDLEQFAPICDRVRE